MLQTGRSARKIVATFVLALLCACRGASPTQPLNSSCDCSSFPPKEGCDAECGITTGVIESVHDNSVTIRVPSVKTTEAGAESPMISDRTFSIDGAEANQLKSITPGSRVALTFRFESGQSVVKSIRKIPKEPAK